MPFSKISKLFLFLFWFSSAFSQYHPGHNYTSADELPNNTVRSLLLDSNHILWVGTDNGVVRKENDVLKYFFEEDGLALNSCWAIAEDRNHKLWFGSYGEGISIYDGNQFKVISEKDGLVHNEITKLFPRGNFMYVGTSNGVSIIDIRTFKVRSLKIPPGDQLFRVIGFFKYKEQIYVASYRSGVYKILENNSRPALEKVNDHQFTYSVFVDNDSIYSGHKGFFTKSSLADYVQDKSSLASKKWGTSIIWDHVKTRNNKIYTAAWGIFDANGGIYEISNDQLISKASEFNVFSKEVLSLAYDPKFERLYAGTKDAGLFEIALNPQIKFHSEADQDVLGFAHTENSSAELLNNALLLKKAEKERKITLFQFKKWQENYLSNARLPLPKHEDDFYELDHSIKAKDIKFYDIKVFSNIYWVNTNIGVFAIKESGELYQYLPLHTEEINFTSQGELIETNPYGGVRIYSDLNTFSYTHFKQDEPHTPTMVVNSLQTRDKTYFTSVFSGLYVWKNEEFKSYLEENIWNEKKLRHITAFGKNLAISNEFGDVYIVNDTSNFQLLEKIPRSKIHGNTISLLKQYRGILIIGTEKGVTFYNKGRFIFYDKEQGLEQPFLSASIRENMLLIGSDKGYYAIDLDEIHDTKALVDQIKLKEIFINNQEFPQNPDSVKEPLRFSYNENSVMLKFSTNAHPYPNKLKYQYRLNSNQDWSLPDSRAEIFLPSLPPENYEIDIQVTDESTGFSYTQPLLRFSILPPFWKTWWFIFLLLSVLLLSVYNIYRFQIRQNRKFEAQKSLIQKRLEETKMEALLAQMNPHFVFNAMNSIQYYIMDSDIDKASRFLGEFAKLIRLNLDHCTQPTILLSDEIEYLQSYVQIENTRFNYAIKVLFEIDPAIDLYETEIPTMILQTFVENVFVHAFPSVIKNPTLKISFSLLSSDCLQCNIEDNGIGFSEFSTNKLHQSKGVNLVKERLTLLGYDTDEALKINSEKNKGTRVTLKLKI